MTIVNKESSWTPPPENLLMVMNIMEQLEKEGNREHASNPDDLPNETKVSNNFPSEAKNGLLSPLNYNLPNSVRYSIDEMLNTDFKEKNHKFEERSEGSSKESEEEQRHGAAHLAREVCECGRRRFWTKSRKDDQDSLGNLINNSTTNLYITDTQTEDRLENFITTLIISVTICSIVFLFWIRNRDLIIKH